MSIKKRPVSNVNRTEKFQWLVREVRRFIAGAVVFNQQLADTLGINATDYQVLNLLDLRGQAKPGDLARLTGLTTGGVTLVLDRLEKAGFARRERNPNDRRSLLIRPVPAKMRTILRLYKPVIAGMQRIASVYNDRELSTVLDFFARSNAFGEARRRPPASS
jgi:DNA-binding MarR family transcriptional regulator